MADFNNLALTANGFKALLTAQAGTTLTLTKIGMGSGSTTSSTVSLVSMVTPEVIMPISEKKIDGETGLMTIVAKMTNEDITKGFYWRETGLFYEDSEGNDVLFSYACVVDDQYDYVPAYSDQRYVKHVRIANIVSDSAEITIKKGEGLLYVDVLTFEEFLKVYDEHVKEFEKHINDTNNPHKVTAKDLGLDNVLTGSINDLTPTYELSSDVSELSSGEKISTAFGKIATAIKSLISHIENKSNPHSVTASQVGLGNVPNVSTNNQTPTYTVGTTLATLTSGEKLSVAFGKIAKAIGDLISHIANYDNPHKVTASQVGALTSGDVVDNLESTATNLPLSANQGNCLAKAQKAFITANGSESTFSLSAGNITKLPLNNMIEKVSGKMLDGKSYAFSLTEDGGIYCPYTGQVLVSGSAYINVSSDSETTNGCYILKNTGMVDSRVDVEVCSQYIREKGIAGGIMAGAKIISVQDGDILYLCARSSIDSKCNTASTATYLSVMYISID